MITTDLQPASIVSDKGFVSLLKVIDPRYTLPSRRTVMRSLLPTKFESEKSRVMSALSSVKYVALTSDIWTSCQTVGYLTLTCHYVNSEWELCSLVLETVDFSVSHTAEHIAGELRRIVDLWGIKDKVVCIVTDNASNCVAAIRLLNWRHLPCYAHTLNLVVRESLKAESQLCTIQQKCKKIVSYFHRSVSATQKLKDIQQQLNLPDKKLINDVETRWNSTFYMFERIVEMNQAITTTLCLTDRRDMLLDTRDVEALKEVIRILKPFEEATTEMSGEVHVSVSKIIPLTRNLQHIVAGSPSRTLQLADSLLTSLRRRFLGVENLHVCAAATLLDPRFKKLAFSDTSSIDRVVSRIQTELTDLDSPHSSPSTEDETSSVQQSGKNSPDLWELFDAKVAEASSKRSSTTESFVETDRYLKQKQVPRSANALEWWQAHCQEFRKLSVLSKKYLCIPATSVPSERLFSKAGELVSARRSRLKPNHINMMLFLNKNNKV